MKQKVVIKVVSMNTPKSRTKAMQIAVCIPGVISAELSGDSKDQIVVIGEGIDATYLTKLIRKKIGFTELVSVAAVQEKKEEKKEEKKIEVPPVVWSPYQYGTPHIEVPPVIWSPYQYGSQHMLVAEVHDQHQDPCTIM